MSKPALLEVAGLRIGTAVRGLDFSLEAGEKVGLIGESGSGKSLTALALMGLSPMPVRGSIRLAGTQLVGAPERVLRRIRGRRATMVFQEPMTALDPLIPVGRQIDRDPRRTSRLMADVGLEERLAGSYPHQLSGGQRQRVLIAMALAKDPDLLICDEPTTALDREVERQIVGLLGRIVEERRLACLFITHNIRLAESFCDRLLVLRDGVFDPAHAASLSAAARVPDFAPPREVGEPIVTLREVTRRFPRRGVSALDGVSLRVPEGARLGIVGASGSGKSTLLRLVAGLDAPTSGAVTVRGTTNLVFQDPYSSLDPRMRVGRSVTESPRATGPAGDLFRAVALPEDATGRFPHEFSGGQRQRISIARALATNPDVLLADEAVSALDVTVRATILDLIDHAVEGRTLIFVTHDLAVVRGLCTHVAVMKAGRIVESGTVREVWERPQDPYTRQLIEGV